MNQNAKHTPGPWSADVEDYPFRREIYIETQDFDPDAGEGERIARVFYETDNGRANARLIASAPALAEALRDCLSFWQSPPDGFGCSASRTARLEKIKMAARAALAQAEGGAQ